MCVKQFFGYNCGHCSIPHLMLCPLAASNPFFPTCAYPAERPLFTDAYCHPCSRIVWNAKVLREEEEHRGRHLRGECLCEVKFEGEEREKWFKDGLTNQTRDSTSGGQDFVQLPGQEKASTLVGTAGETYPGFAHQAWAPQGSPEQHDYLGYYFKREDMQVVDPNLSYTMAVGMHGNRGQLMMGEVRSGMKWHPYSVPFEPSRPRNNTPTAPDAAPPAKTVTESSAGPAELALGGDAEAQQPVVVSSGTEEPDST